MIFIRVKTTIYMIENVRWNPFDCGWVPVFICVNKDGDKSEIDPLHDECRFITGDEAQIMNIAFATVGDLPTDQKFVTEENESDADHLETLNRMRDIEAAIEHISKLKGDSNEC